MLQRLREPVNAMTHLTGAALSLVGLLLLLRLSVLYGTTYHIISFGVFGVSLILLYTASGLYHSLRLPPQGLQRWRRIDHMAIYILIAGTYTPFTLGPLRGAWGWSLFGAVWGLALIGIVVKAFWMKAPRWLNVLFYSLMGWLVVIAFYPLMQNTPPASLFWLMTGGLIYTVGAVIYATKRPNPFPGRFGFHEIWHLFVLGGSFSHYLAVIYLI